MSSIASVKHMGALALLRKSFDVVKARVPCCMSSVGALRCCILVILMNPISHMYAYTDVLA